MNGPDGTAPGQAAYETRRRLTAERLGEALEDFGVPWEQQTDDNRAVENAAAQAAVAAAAAAQPVITVTPGSTSEWGQLAPLDSIPLQPVGAASAQPGGTREPGQLAHAAACAHHGMSAKRAAAAWQERSPGDRAYFAAIEQGVLAAAAEPAPGELSLPDWLAGETSDLGRLRKIMAAVHRCYLEHPEGGQVPTGPHVTISVAENFIAQMLRAHAPEQPAPEMAAPVVLTMNAPEPAKPYEAALAPERVTVITAEPGETAQGSP